MRVEHIIKIASKMYGISLVKSKLMIEQLIQEYSANISEGELLKLVGEKSIFYVGSSRD